MSAIFESILPVFLIVLLGVGLRRWRKISPGLWEGLEQLGFHVLFPALLFSTLYQADFEGLAIAGVSAAALLAVMLFSGVTLALWPLLRRAGIDAPAFTTVVQTSTRWNGFVALAIAAKLYGQTGLGLVALVMGLIVIPINLFNVAVMLRYGLGKRDMRQLLLHIVTNPLILGCAAGIAMRYSPLPLYAPLLEAVDLVARSALAFGLLLVGAGLRVRDALLPRPLVFLPVFLKLFAFPVLMVAIAISFGISGDTLMIMALCGSMPTALNGYLLARQMGGDAPLYAAVATVQTVVSFLSIPLVLALTDQLTSG